MLAIEEAPAPVRQWLAAMQGRQPWTSVGDSLAEDVVFELAGRKMASGRAMLLDRFQSTSGMLKDARWSLQTVTARQVTLRAVGANGPLPSPGGPMSAIDFVLTLDETGRIGHVVPHPHHTEPQQLRQPLAVGELAPDFSLRDTSGALMPLYDSSAKAFLVIFTCNHCPWALGWHPRLQQLAREYSARGVRVLQINANDSRVSPHDALAKCRQRVDNGEFASPYLMDEGQNVARAWGARHTPELFVVDQHGRVAYHGAPDADSENETLNALWAREALDAVLSNQSVSRASTKPVGCTIKWTL